MAAAQRGTTGAGAREAWTARLGLVLAAAGAAIGPGDLWRFPVVAAAHGGGAFILVYLAVVASLGLCLVLAELAIGRAAQRNPVGALRLLGGRLWGWLGLVQILAAFLIASSLSVVAGWTAAAGGALAAALFGGADGDGAALFARILAEPLRPVAAAGVFTAAAVGIVTLGVRRGLERCNRLLVPLLIALLVVLTAGTCTLPGAGAALAGVVRFDFAALDAASITAAIDEAVGTLAIGVGALVVFGAYDRGKANLLGTGAAIAGLDVLAVMLCGAMVLAPVALFALQAEAGPELALRTLAGVFERLPLGLAFGVALMALLLVAMLTTAVALIEPVVAYFTEEHGFRRHQIAIAAGIYAFLLGVPSSLALGGAGNHTMFGRPLAQIIDAIGFDVLAPLAALGTAVFAGWVMGRRAIDELIGAAGGAPWYAHAWLFLLRVPVPLAIGWLLLAPLLA